MTNARIFLRQPSRKIVEAKTTQEYKGANILV